MSVSQDAPSLARLFLLSVVFVPFLTVNGVPSRTCEHIPAHQLSSVRNLNSIHSTLRLHAAAETIRHNSHSRLTFMFRCSPLHTRLAAPPALDQPPSQLALAGERHRPKHVHIPLRDKVRRRAGWRRIIIERPGRRRARGEGEWWERLRGFHTQRHAVRVVCTAWDDGVSFRIGVEVRGQVMGDAKADNGIVSS